MAKSGIRRQRNRLKYLSRLARDEPETFRAEWDKRLESAVAEAAAKAGRLRNGNDQKVSAAFAVEDATLELLRECGGAELSAGPGAEKSLAAVTREVLDDACARAVAERCDRRLVPRTGLARVGASR